jgi:hypothetical protein
VSLAQIVIAKALAHEQADNAAVVAATRWGEGSRAARVLKAAVSAGATSNWGGELVPEYAAAVAEFVAAVRERSIIGNLPLRRVPQRTPILTQGAKAEASWVAEGAPAPLTSMSFSRDTIDLLKVIALAVVSEELLNSADPNAESTITADLVRAVADASDAAFIDPTNAGVAGEQPASITNGLTPVAAAGTFKADLGALIDGYEGDLTAAYLIARPELLLALSGTDWPNVGVRGGELGGMPVIASRNLPLDNTGKHQVVLVDPTGVFYAADEAQAEIKTSRQGAIQMLDNPTNNAVTPTATTLVSLFQTNAVAVGAMMRENWQVARPGAVRLLTGVEA